jgi:transposase-like protein
MVMATCPICKKEVAQPRKELKNPAFTIEAYTCTRCNYSFKVIR